MNFCKKKHQFNDLHLQTQAGNYVRDDVISSTIQLISSSPPIEQGYFALKLWDALQSHKDCESKQPLIQVAFWTMGEYGDLMMNGERIEGKKILLENLETLANNSHQSHMQKWTVQLKQTYWISIKKYYGRRKCRQ